MGYILRGKFPIKVLIPLLVLAFVFFSFPAIQNVFGENEIRAMVDTKPDEGNGNFIEIIETGTNVFSESITYTEVKNGYEKQDLKPVKNKTTELTADNIIKSSKGDIPLISDLEGKTQPALNWTDEYDWFEWEFEIDEDGLYEIDVEYYPLGGTGSTIQRALSIDGKIPFKEANNICFYRVWKEDGQTRFNNIGDEVWPKQVEEKKWLKQVLVDNLGFHSEPLLFHFTKGKHVLRMTYVDQPVVIGSIILRAPDDIPSYEEVLKTYSEKGYKKATQTIKFQAEETQAKNDPTIRRESSNDPKAEPMKPTSRLLNVIGGRRWRNGNQSITWKFNVEEEGLYKITIKLMQSYDDGLPSYRQIAIDGKVPFKELMEYKFEYARDWRGETLQNENGEPYLFYFTKGEHEITMTVKHGPLATVVERTTEDILFLSEIIRKIIMITGSEPDPNYEYELDKKIPGLTDDLRYLAERMKENANILIDISSKVPSIANNYKQICDQLLSMAKDPDKISRALTDLENAQTNLGSYITKLQSRPLTIDYFVISPPDEKVKIPKSNFFERLKVTWLNFIASFYKDYDSVGSIFSEDEENSVILDVWIARGKEWAEILKEMIDEDFTPRTGIRVNMNVVPSGQLNSGNVNVLLLSIISGSAPDVALSVEARSPVEFAFREAVTDLMKFPDYEEIAKRFYPSIMVPYEYNKGIYALPETMDFTVMFYRKDIIQELGLELPETWDDVYQNVLPKLYENGMNFYYPTANGLTPLLFQNGGSFYRDNGTKSGLDTPEAYKAFKQWTDLYKNYRIPIEANFFTRMRNGDMPIGIAGYSMYMQLSTSAPELYGRWGIAPVPGTRKEDGSIDRSVGSIASQACIILEQSDKKEAAWEFLKWWTSEEVQTRYGRELEALLGVEARWNTANTNAFNNLPWDREHIKVIQYQLKQAKEQPVVLGGYFTTRHIDNAWNRVVLNGENVRDSLEKAVKDINKELRSKQEEYGYNPQP